MKKYFKCILILTALIPLGCSKDDDQGNADIFTSQFTLETQDTTILTIEGDPIPFASIDISKSRFSAVNDSAKIVLIVGLGEKRSYDEVHKNTLYVSFINRFNGFKILETQFRNWVSEHAYKYAMDGDQQNGIGVIWFDEHGEIWVSGKNIGEEMLTGKNVITPNNFPNMGSNQQNSEFLLLSSGKFAPESGFDYAQKVHMQFNCMLYNDKGNSLELKNASFQALLNFVKD